MNDRQRAKYASHLAVRTVCNQESHRALWSSLPAFTLLYDRFLAKIALADAAVLVQRQDLTGIAAAKNDARGKLESTTLEVAGALSTLGFLREDADLTARADIAASDLTRLPDAEIDDKALGFLQLARELPPPTAGQPTLADVGLNEGKLDLLETRIETYNLLLGTPRAAIGEKAAATQNLAATLEAIDALLEKGLDKLMLSFRGTDFSLQYESAREIIDPARPNQPAAPANPAAPTPTPPAA